MTAPGTAEAVGLEGTKMYLWRAELWEGEEVTGGRKWCPISGPGLLPSAERGPAIVLQLLSPRNHAQRCKASQLATVRTALPNILAPY